MRSVKPVAVTDATLFGHSVSAEDDVYSAWNSGTTYAAGDRAYLVTTHKVYESLQAGNLNKAPATETSWWIEVGPTNKWAMFDQTIGSSTAAPSVIQVTIALNDADSVNAVGLIDLTSASRVVVEILDEDLGSSSVSSSASASASGSGAASLSSSISASPSTSASSSASSSPSSSTSSSPSTSVSSSASGSPSTSISSSPSGSASSSLSGSPSSSASVSSSISGSPSSSASVSSSVSGSPTTSVSSSVSSSPSASASEGDFANYVIAVGHETSPYLTLYDMDTWEVLDTPAGVPASTQYSVAFNPAETLMAIGGFASPYVTIFNTVTNVKLSDPGDLPTGSVAEVAFSHDGSLLAVAHNISPYITIYNTSDWSKLTDPVALPLYAGLAVAFNHDSSLMAVGADDSPYLYIYNTSDWSKVADPVTLPPDYVNGVAFSPDGSLLVAANDFASPFITIYNTSDWSKVADPAELPGGTCYSVVFSPDGSYLAVGSDTVSDELIIYNTSDWSRVTLSATPSGRVTKLRFSPDGRRLAATHYNSPYVTLYNTETWEKLSAPDTPPAGKGFGVEFRSFVNSPSASYSSSPSSSVSSSASASASASPYPVGVRYRSDVSLGDYGSDSYDWYSYFFDTLELPSAYALVNIPTWSGSLLRVTVYGGADLSIGTLVFGNAKYLGDTQWGVDLGIIDYSTKETDVFGITSVTERAFAKTMSCDLFFTHSALRGIYRFLGEVRATPCLWIGSEEDTWDATIIYGFYKDFSINLRDYGGCFCSLEIEGLV